MSRKGRKVKSCQRVYGFSGHKKMCGQRLPRFSESRYCPSCRAKLESIEERKKYED